MIKKLKQLFKSEKFWLFLILTGGLLSRLYKINSPILDLYPMRQEQVAMIARNFFYNGLSIFNPQVDWFGSMDPSWAMEFPLISYLAALLYKIFGVYEYLGRLIAVFFSIGSIILFFRFLQLFFKRSRTVLLATFFFTFAPLNVYFSRAFMPESLMLFFSLGALYYFYLWLRGEKKWHLLLASGFAALALLSKPFTIFLFLPLFYPAFTKYKKRIFFVPGIWVFFIAAFLPSFFWYSHSEIVFKNYFDPFPVWSNIVFSYDFYLKIFTSFFFFAATPAGLFLLFLGFLIRNKSKEERFFHICFFSLIIFLYTHAPRHFIHYYYQLPFIIVNAVFMAKAVEFLEQDSIIERTIFYRVRDNRSVCLFFAFFFLAGIISIKPFFNWNKNTYIAGKYLDKITPKDSLLIAGRCTQEAPLYYTKRKGWEVNEDGLLSYLYVDKDCHFYSKKNQEVPYFKDEINMLEYLISRGADFYFSVNIPAWSANYNLTEYLRRNFKNVIDEKNLVVFDLRERRESLNKQK